MECAKLAPADLRKRPQVIVEGYEETIAHDTHGLARNWANLAPQPRPNPGRPVPIASHGQPDKRQAGEFARQVRDAPLSELVGGVQMLPPTAQRVAVRESEADSPLRGQLSRTQSVLRFERGIAVDLPVA
jgi:hypothetical protein